EFSVILMNGRGAFNVLRYGWGLVAGRLKHFPDVQLITGKDIVINVPAGQPVQADGDIVATVPVHISVDPEPLRVVS
ncbi:MAG: diacylglycerol kinase, partial [Rhodospirillaceae bacterium]|nr:diacylglycerol kinase [Rhodospirillaceae bacterium]